MKKPGHILGDISLSVFLRDYWQQKPLLIRNAIPKYKCPVSANELAGLACEPEVESRIILEKSEPDWECLNGPFVEEQFSQLPESHWTLLVQSCNLYVPEFALLLEQFKFIPNWRVDDIMVSYAAPGGSVGPHTDNYDVFLLQAQGKRQWSISAKVTSREDLIPDLDMKILKSFEAEYCWVLAPGDMLYLPPGIAHHGVAYSDEADFEGRSKQEDCITVSVGFRAPNVTELSVALLDEVLSNPPVSQHFPPESSGGLTKNSDINFYKDPEIPLQDDSGEITEWALQRIKNLVQRELVRVVDEADWFGKYITRTSEEVEPATIELTPEHCKSMLDHGEPLARNEYSKLSFILRTKSSNDAQNEIHFFCNGEVTVYPESLQALIKLVCNDRFPSSVLLVRELNNSLAMQFFCGLVNQGHLIFEKGIDDE